MKLRTIVYVLTLSSLLGGCRLELSTTEGGSIVTASGIHNCSFGGPCPTIEVVDLFFDETFSAVPDEGFTFSGWRRRNRGLCGGSVEECRLFTSGFEGNEVLMALLEKDEVFFLEAVFEPERVVGNGDARDCWNPELVTPGTTIVTTVNAGAGGRFDFVETVETGELDGESVLIRGGTSQFYGPNDELQGENTGKNYLQVNVPFRSRNLRNVTLGFNDGREVSNSVTTWDPYIEGRFDLVAGESFAQQFASANRTERNGGVEEFEYTAILTTTFDGIEKITVPAGTFNACRFTQETQYLSFSSNIGLQFVDGASTVWYSVGTGLLLDQEEGAGELISGSINGTDI